MFFVEELAHLNYIAIAIATIASYVLGFVWYHWHVFGKAWANALKLTKEQADNTEGLGGAFAISLLSGLTKAVFIAVLLSLADISGLLKAASFGAVIAVVFTATSLGYYNGFARISSKLTWINTTHSIIELTLISAIIGIFT